MFNFIEKILQSAKIILHSRGGLGYILKKNASIASFNINDALFQTIPNIGTVIDIGANIGQYAAASKCFYPESIIHSFEPVPDCFHQLQKNIINLNDVHIYNLALGSTDGTLKFYQNNHTHASSALPISNYQTDNAPGTKTTKEILVPVSTLDTFTFSTSLPSPILLKMDVQGYEMEVLKGGDTFLKKVDYILLETSFTPMYENEPLFDDLHVYLKSKGFGILAPVDFMKSKGRILQMDILYKKK